MDELEPHDLMQINAAEGWLGLGNPVEAHAELDQIEPSSRSHPSVLKVRWTVFAHEKRWDAALETASALVQLEPENVFGWVHRSYALHELKRTKEALENLLPVVNVFFDEIIIRYNMACYECVLGNIEHARLRLAETFNLALSQNCTEEWKTRMKSDPDLKPLWGYWDDAEM